ICSAEYNLAMRCRGSHTEVIAMFDLETNKAIVLRLIEVFNDHRLDLLEEALHPEFHGRKISAFAPDLIDFPDFTASSGADDQLCLGNSGAEQIPFGACLVQVLGCRIRSAQIIHQNR